jgi:hypothetical protein
MFWSRSAHNFFVNFNVHASLSLSLSCLSYSLQGSSSSLFLLCTLSLFLLMTFSFQEFLSCLSVFVRGTVTGSRSLLFVLLAPRTFSLSFCSLLLISSHAALTLSSLVFQLAFWNEWARPKAKLSDIYLQVVIPCIAPMMTRPSDLVTGG